MHRNSGGLWDGSAQLLLEADPAQHGSSLPRLEGHRGLVSADGACHARFHAHNSGARSYRPALPAPLRVIFEVLFLEKQLLFCAEYELVSATDTSQRPISKHHERSPKDLFFEPEAE